MKFTEFIASKCKYRVKLSANELGYGSTLESMRRLCQGYIEQHNLDASSWSGGQVYDGDDMLVAIISYNGRINIVEGYGLLC